jgi:hypothetical protein
VKVTFLQCDQCGERLDPINEVICTASEPDPIGGDPFAIADLHPACVDGWWASQQVEPVQ